MIYQIDANGNLRTANRLLDGATEIIAEEYAERLAYIRENAVHIEYDSEAAEREHWLGDYDSLVDEEIRKRYTVSQEFAILRQRDEKPTEYAAYYAYCEECKAFVKAQREKYGEVQ